MLRGYYSDPFDVQEAEVIDLLQIKFCGCYRHTLRSDNVQVVLTIMRLRAPETQYLFLFEPKAEVRKHTFINTSRPLLLLSPGFSLTFFNGMKDQEMMKKYSQFKERGMLVEKRSRAKYS